MAYDRHIGTNNEAITYQKLNTIEDAVSELNSPSSSKAIIVNANFVSSGDVVMYELDKTGNEIYSYILEGNYVVIVANDHIPYRILFATPVLSVDEYLPSSDELDDCGSIRCKNCTGSTYEGADSYPVAYFRDL